MDPSDTFMAEAVFDLTHHHGISPTANAEGAADTLWGDYEKLTDESPSCWKDVVGKLSHPQLQATLAWYRAIGPYRLSLGLSASPPDLPELETGVEQSAEVEEAPPPPPAEKEIALPIPRQEAPPALPLPSRKTISLPSKPIAQILMLPEENYSSSSSTLPNTARFQPTPQHATELHLALREGRDDRLIKWIRRMTDEIEGKGWTSVDIFIDVRQVGPEMSRLIGTWMNKVRFDYPRMKLFFKDIHGTTTKRKGGA